MDQAVSFLVEFQDILFQAISGTTIVGLAVRDVLRKRAVKELAHQADIARMAMAAVRQHADERISAAQSRFDRLYEQANERLSAHVEGRSHI